MCLLKLFRSGSEVELRSFREDVKFHDIQELVTKDVELAPEVDYADFFDSIWRYVLTLRYAFFTTCPPLLATFSS